MDSESAQKLPDLYTLIPLVGALHLYRKKLIRAAPLAWTLDIIGSGHQNSA